jgi:hypothetical protein
MVVFPCVQFQGEKIILNPFKVEFSHAINENEESMPPYKRQLNHRKVSRGSSSFYYPSIRSEDFF